MRILWHSNAPLAPTGYGMQTALFAPRLRDLGHDVAISAYWGLGGGITWKGIRVYPGDDRWGNRTLKAFAAHWQEDDDEPCLTLTLTDVWVLDPAQMPERLACWCPIDQAPVSSAIIGFLRKTKARPIAMSRFGVAELERVNLDPLYVPHGVDTAMFRPLDGQARLAFREEAGIPADAFVVGMVANNKGAGPSRKAFPEVFEAFGRFRQTRRDAFLYVHADAGPHDGLPLAQVAAACGIPRRAVRFTDPANYTMGVAAEYVAGLHAAFDVLANPSYGEGFGIPIVEAQACGTPVIVTDWTSMPELCGAGWVVEGDRWYNHGLDSWYKRPRVDAIVAALEEAYDQAAGLRDQAAAFGAGYDADGVVEEFWRPALDALAVGSREAVAA